MTTSDITKKQNYEVRVIGKHAPTFGELISIKRGEKVISAFAEVSVFLTVIIQEGIVLGCCVFELESTQSFLDRCNKHVKTETYGYIRKGKEKPILVFGEKYPSVSSETIHQLIEAEMRGVVLQTDVSKIADLQSMVEIADQNKIFIVNLVEDSHTSD